MRFLYSAAIFRKNGFFNTFKMPNGNNWVHYFKRPKVITKSPPVSWELQQKTPWAKTLRTKTLQQKTPPVKNSPSETACRSKTPQQDFRSKTPRSKTPQQDFRSKTPLRNLSNALLENRPRYINYCYMHVGSLICSTALSWYGPYEYSSRVLWSGCEAYWC